MGSMDFLPSVEQAGPPVTQEPLAWYDVWVEVLTRPSRESFRRILADPTAGPARAFAWVAAVGLIVGLVQVGLAGYLGISPLSELANGGLATGAICFGIAAPLGPVIGLALSAAILHGIARLLKGRGSFRDMAYCLGAVQAPVSAIAALTWLASLAASGGGESLASGEFQPVLTLCLAPFSLAILVYAIVLEALAVSAVEKFGAGKAVLVLLIPVIIGILLGACLAGAITASGFG